MNTLEEIRKAYSDLKGGGISFLICMLNPGKIIFDGDGNGVVVALDNLTSFDEFLAFLPPDKIGCAVFRAVLQRGEVCRWSLVRVNWVGAEVPAKHRAGALSIKQELVDVFGDTIYQFDENESSQISAGGVFKRLISVGGSFKADSCSFGRSTVEVGALSS